MSLCSKCGANVAPNEKFCGSCGAPQPLDDTPMPDTGEVDKAVTGEPKAKAATYSENLALGDTWGPASESASAAGTGELVFFRKFPNVINFAFGKVDDWLK